MRVVLSPKAERDLSGIYNYSLRSWGDEQVDAYQSSIFAALDLLVHSPRLGRRIPGRLGDFRLLRAEGHLTYYQILDDQIWVIRILHPKQLLELDDDEA